MVNCIKSVSQSEKVNSKIERACVAPCVVLVINDNLYRLMFALRYLYRSCPWEKIGVHVLDSRRLYDDQGSIQGFI